MRILLKLNGKRITKKALYEKYGKARVDRFIGDATDTYKNYNKANPMRVIISLEEEVLITFVENSKGSSKQNSSSTKRSK